MPWRRDSREDAATARSAGAAYVFRYSGGSGPGTYVKASNTESPDASGFRVVLDADGHTPDRSLVKAEFPMLGYRSGHSLAVSGDATTLVLGSVNESSNAMGINGNQQNTSGFRSDAVWVRPITS